MKTSQRSNTVKVRWVHEVLDLNSVSIDSWECQCPVLQCGLKMFEDILRSHENEPAGLPEHARTFRLRDSMCRRSLIAAVFTLVLWKKIKQIYTMPRRPHSTSCLVWSCIIKQYYHALSCIIILCSILHYPFYDVLSNIIVNNIPACISMHVVYCMS